MNSKKSRAIPLLLATVMLSSAYAEMSGKKGDNCGPGGCNMVPKGCPTLCTSYLDINCNNLMVDVGILVEQFKLTGTQFGFTSFGGVPGNAVNTLPRNASILKPQFKLKWGVTAALGYYFAHDDWLLKGRFDWIRSTGSRGAEAEYNQFIVPSYIWESGILPGATNGIVVFEQVSSHISVNYYNLDIDLNRGSFMSTCVSIEPHIGLKSTWIDYKHSIRYDSQNPNGQPADVKRVADTEFWGMGPAFGLNSVWNLMDDVGLFFDNNIALLFGRSSVTDEVWNVSNSEDLATRATSSPTVLSPAVRAIFGVQWERACFNNTQHIMLRAGVDTAAYWNQFQHINVTNGVYGTTGATTGGLTLPVTDPQFLEQNNDIFGMIGLIVELKWDF